MIGEGDVQVSPLTMALVAAAAQNGTWKPPYVLKDVPKTVQAPPPQNLQPESIASLKKVLARTASHGNARGARVSGDLVGVAALTAYREGSHSTTFPRFAGSVGHRALATPVARAG